MIAMVRWIMKNIVTLVDAFISVSDGFNIILICNNNNYNFNLNDYIFHWSTCPFG